MNIILFTKQMLFNYDLLIGVGSVIVGGVFTYSFYNNIFTTNNSESLVNTIPSLDSIGSQATELPVTSNNYLDIGVQTESNSLWSLFKDWLREVFSVNCSDVGSFGQNKVSNWINNLESTQSLPSQNVISQASVTNLDTLVNVDDSASNVTAISSVEPVIPVIPYDINDVETYNNLLALQNINFSSALIDGVQQHFIIIGEAILAINLAVMNMNYFI